MDTSHLNNLSATKLQMCPLDTFLDTSPAFLDTSPICHPDTYDKSGRPSPFFLYGRNVMRPFFFLRRLPDPPLFARRPHGPSALRTARNSARSAARVIKRRRHPTLLPIGRLLPRSRLFFSRIKSRPCVQNFGHMDTSHLNNLSATKLQMCPLGTFLDTSPAFLDTSPILPPPRGDSYYRTPLPPPPPLTASLRGEFSFRRV